MAATQAAHPAAGQHFITWRERNPCTPPCGTCSVHQGEKNRLEGPSSQYQVSPAAGCKCRRGCDASRAPCSRDKFHNVEVAGGGVMPLQIPPPTDGFYRRADCCPMLCNIKTKQSKKNEAATHAEHPAAGEHFRSLSRLLTDQDFFLSSSTQLIKVPRGTMRVKVLTPLYNVTRAMKATCTLLQGDV